jgi:UDP-N-acetylglucosamine--N-acetylmuramyl-(pentapeptide) pyrophosphoryl-undecaprenol N-acetylglucosamine transferase
MGDPGELRVVIAAGGTGGHLFPGIAVAREFLVRHQAEVTFLTTPKAVTTQILERYGCAWEAVAARALQGEGLFSRGRTLLGVPGAVLAARTRLQNINPHLVLGMGGHASGPAGVAARLLGTKNLRVLSGQPGIFPPGARHLDRQPHSAGVF